MIGFTAVVGVTGLTTGNKFVDNAAFEEVADVTELATARKLVGGGAPTTTSVDVLVKGRKVVWGALISDDEISKDAMWRSSRPKSITFIEIEQARPT